LLNKWNKIGMSKKILDQILKKNQKYSQLQLFVYKNEKNKLYVD
jgi:hypothetical protein